MSELNTSTVHYFGIRHHGPGCARSLLTAFEQLQPDCVLIEGPPEANELLHNVLDAQMCPPIALLSYCVDSPKVASFHPYAVFSPEWQALLWAQKNRATTRFIDLPMSHTLAVDKQGIDELAQSKLAPPSAVADDPTELEDALDTAATPQHAPTAAYIQDPLDALAHAAGFTDGESWWNSWVEERGDGEGIFAAISEAMIAVRAELGQAGQANDIVREEQREAYMRQCIRAAQKEGFTRIAVVCGAWHLGGLRSDKVSVKQDLATLKGLPKVKVSTTWVPWTYRHLSMASGYGAGVKSPGWYHHVWKGYATGQAAEARGIAWLARIAKLLRERDIDCSSAHLIEAARLAQTLAALRLQPQPSLQELQEACRSVLLMGDNALLALIHDALVISDRLGTVPLSVPTVPLQRDLELQQKSLRLKPEALEKTLDLDLRTPNDLARSHLLHRLLILQIAWGTKGSVGQGAKGTFHEIWTLQWQPEFIVTLIQASTFGQNIEQAATGKAIQTGEDAHSLQELAQLIDHALLANLPLAVHAIAQTLNNRAAITGDVMQLLAAMPALANVFRYGNVRQTNTQLIGDMLDALIIRASIGLPLSAHSLDDDAAQALRDVLLAANAAVVLRTSALNAQEQGADQAKEPLLAWEKALVHMAHDPSAHALLRGLCTRLLLDRDMWGSDKVAQELSLQLSFGAEPAKAAAWLEGFLNRNALVLLHDAAVWQLVDTWLAGLAVDLFVRILPLVRRAFSSFTHSERHDLGALAASGVSLPSPSANAGQVNLADMLDLDRTLLALPVLQEIWRVSK